MGKRDDEKKTNMDKKNTINNQELFDQLMHDLEQKRDQLNKVAEEKYEKGESLAEVALCEEQRDFNEASIRLRKLMKDIKDEES